MYIFLSIVIVILAILLVFIVTIQSSKGGGLAAGFSSSNKIMGVQRTTDLLEKVTWGLAIAIGVLAILSARWAPRATNAVPESQVLEQVRDLPSPVSEDVSPFGTPTLEEMNGATEPVGEADDASAEPAEE